MSPSNALDPLVMLATGIHSNPGVYALLLGSGVSTGAGIPTGWGVVQELVRRAAAAKDPDNRIAADDASANPEAWWSVNGDGLLLGYSNLLAALAPTPGARRGLLSRFFEPNDRDLDERLKVPSAAHHAIAQMARRGLIRVILTTNFDRLMERALEDVGASPQIISRPEQVTSMTPLQHAPVTIIKLHGDYIDLETRNTVDELSTYNPKLNRLLDRVFDEYGLIVAGWSGQWDRALVRALERMRSRRYPIYWDSRSSVGESARQLLAQQAGVVVTAASADVMFTDLLASLDALDRLAEPPLTTAMAVTRLKRYLPDPVRQIEIYDLVTSVVDDAVTKIRSIPTYRTDLDGQALQDVFDELLSIVTPSLHLLMHGVFHGGDRRQVDLWIESIRRLMFARRRTDGVFLPVLDQARHYPALLALRTASVASLLAQRDDVLYGLLLEPKWRDNFDSRVRTPAVIALNDYRVLDAQAINSLPRWNGQRWLYPPSHLLREDLRATLSQLITEEDDYTRAMDAVEYRIALIGYCMRDDNAMPFVPGEFIIDGRWGGASGLASESEFRDVAQRAHDDWPWWKLVGGREGLDKTLLDLRTALGNMRRFG